MITQDRLKEVLVYDAETGFFYWKVRKSYCIKIGDRAGNLKVDGYWGIKIDEKTYHAHRLAWLYTYGEFPKGHLDHKDRVKSDCRIDNLREATREQNLANQKARRSRSGLRGVHWHKRTKKWAARVTRNGKQDHLGYFHTAEEAHAAWCVAAAAFHGEFFYSGVG